VIQGKTDSGEILGSGFIISKDGMIVTNLHVIRDMKTASVHVSSRPIGRGWSIEGKVFDSVFVLATDETKDLAIIKIAAVDLPVLGLGNSDTLTVGEPVVVVGMRWTPSFGQNFGRP
jgi:serine protease Do